MARGTLKWYPLAVTAQKVGRMESNDGIYSATLHDITPPIDHIWPVRSNLAKMIHNESNGIGSKDVWNGSISWISLIFTFF